MNVLNRKVLQLNAHYEPDGIITMCRAVTLVFKNHARIEVIDHSRVLRTSTTTYPVPSVIVLTTQYVNKRKKRQESNKRAFHIMVRDKFRCQYCAKRLPPFQLTLDHIMPKSRGGGNDSENLATACIPCNQRKGNRTPDEARMPLLATPSALRYGLDRAMLVHLSEERPEWQPYLFLGEKVA